MLGADVVAYVANLLSAILSGGVIYAFIFKRKEMSAVLAALVGAFIERRIQKVRETIREIEKLSWNEKDIDRPRIKALIGQLCGQMKGLVREIPSLKDISDQFEAMHRNPRRMTEAEKCRLVHELEGELDRVGWRVQ